MLNRFKNNRSNNGNSEKRAHSASNSEASVSLDDFSSGLDESLVVEKALSDNRQSDDKQRSKGKEQGGHQRESSGIPESGQSKAVRSASPIRLLSIKRVEYGTALKAYANVSILEVLHVRGCVVIEGSKGLFASLPKTKGKDNIWRNIVEFNLKPFEDEFQRVLLKAYEDSELTFMGVDEFEGGEND